MTWSRPLSIWLAPALALALAVVVILFDGLGIQTALSNRLFDAYQRHSAREASAAIPVRILDLPALDEDSLVAVSRLLAQNGARLVVFTAPLAPGPSPQALAAKLPPGSDVARAALARLPEPGHDLAAALSEITGVVPVRLGAAGREPRIKARFVYRGTSNPFRSVPRFDSAAAPNAMLETQAAGSGAANLPADADGVVRRLPLAFRLGAALVPGLAAEALRVADNKADIIVISNERDPLSFLTGVGIGGLETGGKIVPTTSDGRIWLRYAANVSARTLNPNALDAASLKGAIVIVGAAGALVRTPFGAASVASVTAEGVENLLTGDVLARPLWARPAEALALVLAGTAMILLLRFGLGWSAAAMMAAVAVFFLVSWSLFAAHGLLVDAATPALGLALAFACGTAAWIQDMWLAYAGLRMAFADSLPRASIEKIARRPHLLRMEGETRTVTYLVCGVRGLAGLAAAHRDDAGGFTSLMQKLLTPLMDQALAHGGTIDRLTADGFAAFWNAPLDDADPALHACEAASGMTAMAARVSEELAPAARGTIEIGIGIATGPVIAGGFGGYGRMGYSVHGDAVALAQRIQALSPQYGPALIVAEATKAEAERGFAFLEIDTIAAGPGDPPSALYAVMGSTVMRASPKFRALTVFHDHIFQAIRKRQWQRARELIGQCRRLSGASQKLYDLHLTRIAWYEQHPPGENWDGAFRPILE